MKKTVIGILAHVDAGKTTLAEALLYHAGKLKKPGRVDHGDTLLDTHALERARGITIFSSQAVFTLDNLEITLLDTPGHVDFSAETERVLKILDYAILVISGTDGVQAHTRTLWRLLELYALPVFIFVTKMDLARRTREDLMAELRRELGEACVDFSADAVPQRMESLALLREDLLEGYLEGGTIPDASAAELIRARRTFPCYFGSGLKLAGINDFLEGLSGYLLPTDYPNSFGAKVFKISHDAQGNRLTHLKVTGGTLRVRDSLAYDGLEEKVSQIRIYSGARFVPAEEVSAGGVCAVLGLSGTRNGQGLGIEAASAAPLLEPVMNYRILPPLDCDVRTLLPRLRELEEEDPQLHITWNGQLQEIHVGLMGTVQAEILKSLILERFHTKVKIDAGQVLYKETIEAPAEGVGHYEPLRHYAEVHLLLEPLPRGSGLVFATQCSEDQLDRNWQQLVLTHLAEKHHLGVLTGSPVTDMKITLAAGRAHLKHTEGGDFRQATYRAVRQGLMGAKTLLLEPYYTFRLELPREQLGRAVNDIRARCGSLEAPQETSSMALLRGTAPVASMNDYAMEVAAYTRGRGRLLCEPAGYGPCHNPEEVTAAFAYNPEADLENTPDSVFCAHGSSFIVKWDKVPEYMHLESCLRKERPAAFSHRYTRLDDRELQAIIERELGPIRRPLYRTPEPNLPAQENDLFMAEQRARHLIVDGYNVIFAWDDLREAAKVNLEAARNQLTDILSNYAAYTGCEVVLVFDAYRVGGNSGRKLDIRGVQVVYTRENESADLYIEKLAAQMGKDYQVRVVTSDGLIQLSALRAGVLRMSAAEFGRELEAVNDKIERFLERLYLSRQEPSAPSAGKKENPDGKQ